MNKPFAFLLPLLLPNCFVEAGESAAAQYYIDVQTLQNGIPLGLSCKGTAAVGPIEWMKDNVTVTNSDDIVIDSTGLNLRISKTIESSLGNYTCRYVNTSTILSFYQVISEPVVKFTSDDEPSVVEGEKLRLTCFTTGPLFGPNVTWTFRNEQYRESRDRVKILKDETTGVERAVLVVDNFKMDDFGNVTCSIRFTKISGAPTVNATTYVRVKNKLAALWPFLGICAEVIILCAIILIYEKKRNKTELEDSDTDQSPETKPTPNKDTEVRHRK